MKAPAEVEAPVLTEKEARELTDRIKVRGKALVELLTKAFFGRAWSALGYDSYDAWWAGELRGLNLSMPDRKELVATLAGEGMSGRGIAAAVGASEATVRRDLSGATNDAPAKPLERSEVTPMFKEKVVGKDGKKYPAKAPKNVDPPPVGQAVGDAPRSPTVDSSHGERDSVASDGTGGSASASSVSDPVRDKSASREGAGRPTRPAPSKSKGAPLEVVAPVIEVLAVMPAVSVDDLGIRLTVDDLPALEAWAALLSGLILGLKA